MTTVAELAAYETFAVLAAVLPPPPAALLEVGCGQGALAALLDENGYRVTGLEPDPDRAALARKRDVHVLDKGVLDHTGGPYDAVLFSRSLHVVEQLGEVIAHSLEMLTDGGLLVAEEFRREAVSLRAAGFCYDTAELLAAAGLETEASGHPDIDDPLERWDADLAVVERSHPLHTGMRIVTELRRRADVVFERETPGLWRHILRGPAEDSEDPRVEAVAEILHRVERRRVAEGTLPPVGLIVAARPQSS
jgi:SAM-dependent methyltransferase